jgi:excisionase family DNA binding protein
MDTLNTPAPDAAWLLPAEAAAILKVHPRTVGKWAIKGKITAQRTLGGHRRYDGPEIRALADALKAVA